MLIMIAAASCEKENPLPSLDNGFNAGFGYVGGYSSRNAAFEQDWSSQKKITLVTEYYKLNDEPMVKTLEVPLPWAWEDAPMHGFMLNDCLVIPVASAFEAADHFRSLATPVASLKEEGNTIVWSLTDGQGDSQGNAVFSLGDNQDLARISLPGSFHEGLRTVVYRNAEGLLRAVSPEIKEELEDYYYYGAIVDISDHGCGSGKFVVLREYNFANGANGLAIRLDNTRWHLKKLPDDGHLEMQIFNRASCLSTMNTAKDILKKDWSVLTKQLATAGSRQPGQHFASSNRAVTGWNYYLCFHDGECDTIGPLHDLEFYECWLYWFYPDGNRIIFW